jgi:hypothetical protein
MPRILLKKKDTAGAPLAADILNTPDGAEVAISTDTGRMYVKNAAGSVIPAGANVGVKTVVFTETPAVSKTLSVTASAGMVAVSVAVSGNTSSGFALYGLGGSQSATNDQKALVELNKTQLGSVTISSATKTTTGFSIDIAIPSGGAATVQVLFYCADADNNGLTATFA